MGDDGIMNYIWACMLLLGIAFSFINGDLSGFTDGFMESCGQGVEFVFGLIGILCVWSGIMNIAEKSGLIDVMSRAAMPLMRFLFPYPLDKDIIAMMLMSFTANIFGAGSSATVFSLKAMQLMDNANGHSRNASNAMCMFAAVSMSMLQLVPVSLIKIRADLGSADPGDIILPGIIAGIFSMAASILFCKLCEMRGEAR